MTYTPRGPFTNDAAPPINADMVNDIEDHLELINLDGEPGHFLVKDAVTGGVFPDQPVITMSSSASAASSSAGVRQTITIPQNEPALGDSYIVRFSAQMTNSTGSAVTPTVSLHVGATQVGSVVCEEIADAGEDSYYIDAVVHFPTTATQTIGSVFYAGAAVGVGADDTSVDSTAGDVVVTVEVTTGVTVTPVLEATQRGKDA